MPKQSKGSLQSQLSQLRKLAGSLAGKGKAVLLCLDDMWESRHESAFDCLGESDQISKLLVTTRYL